MKDTDTNLFTGDWVEVKGAQEIANTLDSQGTLDGLPFMSEMAEFCGRRLRVLRRAEKSCVEVRFGAVSFREFRNNDVVLLEGLRCSGVGHGGCQRACTLFWKTAWLRKAIPIQSADEQPDVLGLNNLVGKLKQQVGPNQFRCQSTQLADATQALSRVGILKKCFADIRSGSRGVFEMAKLILFPIWRKATPWFRKFCLAGSLKRTPTEALNLQPGEWVEVKSVKEIGQTLDSRGYNRGLSCVTEMGGYCGGKYRVKSRVDRMILEFSGEMRTMANTVILEGIECRCVNVVGGCPRQEPMFWREIWLRRAEDSARRKQKSFLT